MIARRGARTNERAVLSIAALGIAAVLGAAFLIGCSVAPTARRTAAVGESPGATSSSPRETPAPPPPPSSAAEAKTPEPSRPAAPEDSSLALGGAAKASEPRAGTVLRTEAAGPRPAPRAEASGLKAGFADDNRQFNYFVQFLERYAAEVPHRSIPIGERIVLRVADSAGKSVANAAVKVSGGGKLLAEGLTYADGTFLFFPLEHDSGLSTYQVEVSALGRRQVLDIARGGPRTVTVRFDRPRASLQQVPLDLLFVLDTTGSMGEEIERLKTTIEIINLNLASLAPKPRIRFGMVLYKDRGDDPYVTHVVPFTTDLAAFQAALDPVEADGGGDTPEDLEAALEQAMHGVSWSTEGVRLAFVITDAPSHLDEYNPRYTYVDAVHDARKRGVKFFSIGTGGLPLEGELMLRQIAQYTYGKYIFLTYGEQGESEGGAPGSVSHHTGANFQTDKLETIIIRFAKEELSYLTDRPLEQGEDYFQAQQVASETREDTLAKLFEASIGQLADYSAVRIQAGTRAATVPIVPMPSSLALDAEYFSDALTMALSRNRTFTAVERRDLQAILAELELQLSGLADEANAARVGKLLGAELLFTGSLYRKPDCYEVFLKLVRVETGEVLSVTKARIDLKLGLSG